MKLWLNLYIFWFLSITKLKFFLFLAEAPKKEAWLLVLLLSSSKYKSPSANAFALATTLLTLFAYLNFILASSKLDVSNHLFVSFFSLSFLYNYLPYFWTAQLDDTLFYRWPSFLSRLKLNLAPPFCVALQHVFLIELYIFSLFLKGGILTHTEALALWRILHFTKLKDCAQITTFSPFSFLSSMPQPLTLFQSFLFLPTCPLKSLNYLQFISEYQTKFFHSTQNVSFHSFIY